MRVSRLLRISPLARDCQSVIPPPAIKQKEATRRAYRNIQLAALRNPQRGGRAEVDRAPPKALSDGESGPQGSLGSAKKRASPRKTMAGRGQGGHVQYRQQLTNNRFLVSSLIGGQLVGACASKMRDLTHGGLSRRRARDAPVAPGYIRDVSQPLTVAPEVRPLLQSACTLVACPTTRAVEQFRPMQRPVSTLVACRPAPA